jgi:hypothetical protein
MKKFIALAWFGFLLAAPSNESWGQAVPRLTISGQIKDSASNLPLSNVNVFLANTTLGAVSDKNGLYNIRGVSAGTHELVASLLGYEVRKSSIRVTDNDLRVDLSLMPKLLEMSQIDVVAAPDREWKNNLQKFEELFWGNAYRASECKIVNPEVLDFSIEKDSGCFIATASQPLQIENRRLGYRAQFIVQEFRYYLNDKEIKFAFIPKFDELPPGDDGEEKKWRDNRLKAYHGSFRHFLAALIAGRLEEDGFLVATLPGLPWEGEYSRFLKRKVGDFAGLLSPAGLSSEVEFNFQGCMEIVYKPEQQTSWLVTNRDYILLNKAGYAYDGYAFVLYGHWFLQRAAEMLPRDYVP